MYSLYARLTRDLSTNHNLTISNCHLEPYSTFTEMTHKIDNTRSENNSGAYGTVGSVSISVRFDVSIVDDNTTYEPDIAISFRANVCKPAARTSFLCVSTTFGIYLGTDNLSPITVRVADAYDEFEVYLFQEMPINDFTKIIWNTLYNFQSNVHQTLCN